MSSASARQALHSRRVTQRERRRAANAQLCDTNASLEKARNSNAPPSVVQNLISERDSLRERLQLAPINASAASRRRRRRIQVVS